MSNEEIFKTHCACLPVILIVCHLVNFVSFNTLPIFITVIPIIVDSILMGMAISFAYSILFLKGRMPIFITGSIIITVLNILMYIMGVMKVNFISLTVTIIIVAEFALIWHLTTNNIIDEPEAVEF